jgi:hypothetical protein
MGWLISLVLGLWKTFLEPRANRTEVVAREAVAAEVTLAAERAGDDLVKKADAAVCAVDARSVSDIAAFDPNNRAG